MASAFQVIVDIYVRNGNRKAIHESLAHRRKLSTELKSVSDADRHLALLTELAHEIALLEAGLNRLDGVAEHAPDQNAAQALAPTDETLIGPKATASDRGPPTPKPQAETSPPPKHVEIVAVEISGAPPTPTRVAAAPEGGSRPVSVQIVGLTIKESSARDSDRSTEPSREQSGDGRS
jgi:hypothetical protein